MGAIPAVFQMASKQMFSAKKVLGLVLLALAPAALGLLIRATSVKENHSYEGSPEEIGLFCAMFQWGVIQIVLLATALFGATGLIADEAENKTLVYLLLRPVTKPVLLLGRFIAFYAVGLGVCMFSAAVTWLCTAPLSAIPENSRDIGRMLLAILFGLFAFGALFTLFGVWAKRAVIWALVWGFGWESIVSLIPGALKKFTLMFYLRAIPPYQAAPSDEGLSELGMSATIPPTSGVGMLTLVVAGILLLALAVWIFTLKEYSSPDNE